MSKGVKRCQEVSRDALAIVRRCLQASKSANMHVKECQKVSEGMKRCLDNCLGVSGDVYRHSRVPIGVLKRVSKGVRKYQERS